MSMTFSAEQDELRKGVRRFLEQKSSSADVRRLMETDEDRKSTRLNSSHSRKSRMPSSA